MSHGNETKNRAPEKTLRRTGRTKIPLDEKNFSPDGNYFSPDGNYFSPDGNYFSPDGNYFSPDEK
jgi:hypothetical protein